jgi:hypothetical protein
MTFLFKRKLLIAALALVLLGGGAAAFAATQSSSGRHRYLDDAAKRLGVSPSALASALRAARVDHIEAEVAKGRLSRSQANALEQRIREGRAPRLGSRLRVVRRDRLVSVAAKYLGISEAKLREERRAGKSLAQIASSTPGKSVDGLKAALVSSVKARLDAAVASGRLTAQQQRSTLSSFSGRVQRILDRSATRPRA